jgi:hypothetical protein
VKLPELDEKLREKGIIKGETGGGWRPLMEMLYGVIEPSEEFEQLVKKYHAKRQQRRGRSSQGDGAAPDVVHRRSG